MVGKLVFLRSENGLLSASIYSASAQQRLSHLVGAAPAVAGAGYQGVYANVILKKKAIKGLPKLKKKAFSSFFQGPYYRPKI